MVFFLNRLNANWEDFKTSILENVYASGLELDTSEYSFFNKIMEALSKSSSEMITAIDQLASQNSFDHTNSNSLDFVFEFFNIKRLNINSDSYQLSFVYTGTRNFSIKSGTYFFIDGKTYQSRYSVDVSNEYKIKTFTLEVFEVSSLDASVFELVKIGNYSFLSNGLSYVGEKYEFLNYLQSVLSVNDFSVISSSYESDNAFLNRAKNILQFLAADTPFKIKKALLDIDGVTDVIIQNQDFDSLITIIPKNLEELDNILLYSEEIINYYKNRNFILKKPILNSFEIKNLMEFVDESLKEDVENFVKVFIRDLYLNKNTFSRPVFEFKVFEYLQKLGNSKVFSKDNLEIIYSVFDSCDFNYELYNGKIYNEEERVFSDGLFLCKKVG